MGQDRSATGSRSLPSTSNQMSASSTDPDSLAQRSSKNTLKNTSQKQLPTPSRTPCNPSTNYENRLDCILVVRNLPKQTTSLAELRKKFSKFGPLKAVKKRGHQDYGKVEFEAAKDALEAKRCLHKTLFCGRRICIEYTALGNLP